MRSGKAMRADADEAFDHGLAGTATDVRRVWSRSKRRVNSDQHARDDGDADDTGDEGDEPPTAARAGPRRRGTPGG